MARSVSRKRWPRKQSSNLVFFRVLDVFGIGLVIVCVLLTLYFVLLEAGDYFHRKQTMCLKRLPREDSVEK